MTKLAFTQHAIERQLQCTKLLNFISMRKHSCLLQPLASNACRVNEPLSKEQYFFQIAKIAFLNGFYDRTSPKHWP